MNPPDIEQLAYREGKQAQSDGKPTFHFIIRGYEAYYYTPSWWEVRRAWEAYTAGKEGRAMPTHKPFLRLVVEALTDRSTRPPGP